MNYAVSNWIYGDEPLRMTFARLAPMGYSHLELIGEPERYSTAEIRELCSGHSMGISAVLGWCIAGIPGRDLASTDGEERMRAIEYGQRIIDFAAEVEAPIVVVIPASAGRTAPSGRASDERSWRAAYQREWDLAVDSVRQAAEHAAAQDITLAIEPINRYETFLVSNLEQAAAFADAVGMHNVGIHLDTFHMSIEESEPAGAVLRAGKRLINMHLSDSNREAPGRGHLDFGEVLRALKQIEYQGVLALEPVPPGSDPLLASTFESAVPLRDVYAEEGIRFLRQLEAEIEG